MTFHAAVQERMSDYKLQKLGIQEHGFWRRSRNISYAHILPDRQWDLNLLGHYRTDLFGYIKANNLRLQPDFHHLNSSQAVCFNFFYPFLTETKEHLLLQALGIQAEQRAQGEFEKVFAGPERTSFDFWMNLPSGRNIFFKINYSETSFGQAADSLAFFEKYRHIYKERLDGKIKKSANAYKELVRHYELLRHVSYLEPKNSDAFFVICPEDNQALRAEWEHLQRQVIHPALHSCVRLITWEALLLELLPLLQSAGAPRRMRDHYEAFEEKYVY